MRSFILTTLLCAAAAAQPSPADSALVERTIAGLRMDLAAAAFENMGNGFKTMVPPTFGDGMAPFAAAFADLDLEAVGDSVRQAFYQDLRPDLLEQALVYLEGPVPQIIIDQSPFPPGQPVDPAEMMALLEDSGDRPLADSSLAVRFSDAMTSATQQAEMQAMMAPQMIEAMVSVMPPSLRAEFEQQGGAEMIEGLITSAGDVSQLEAVRPMLIRTYRLALGGVDEDALEVTTAYYESEAGEYVSRLSSMASARAMMPTFVRGMADTVRPLFAQIVEREKARDLSAREPVLEGSVYEVAETMPELIGGMADLQSRVVYPESARQDEVEGRVMVEFVVAEDGRVRNLEVTRSPDERLSEAALASRFKPGRNGGKAVAVRFTLPVTFRLQ